MKIVRKDRYSICEFGELRQGEVFIEIVDGNEEWLQMKTSEVDSDETYNAVSLSTGEMYFVEAGTKVKRVDAELIIRNIEEV